MAQEDNARLSASKRGRMTHYTCGPNDLQREARTIMRNWIDDPTGHHSISLDRYGVLPTRTDGSKPRRRRNTIREVIRMRLGGVYDFVGRSGSNIQHDSQREHCGGSKRSKRKRKRASRSEGRQALIYYMNARHIPNQPNRLISQSSISPQSPISHRGTSFYTLIYTVLPSHL
jgi:hypothetical protein